MWKSVAGYESLYEVSDDGQVKSLARLETVNAGWSRVKKEKLLKQTLDHNGYAYVDLCHQYAKKRFYIHQLALSTFGDARPDGLVACHNDGNCTNNKIENLRWDTQKNNLNDKIKHGTIIQGGKHKLSKLTSEDVLLIRSAAFKNVTHEEVASKFGVSRRLIGRVLRREVWKHI